MEASYQKLKELFSNFLLRERSSVFRQDEWAVRIQHSYPSE
jgi:hypothetical protein